MKIIQTCGYFFPSITGAGIHVHQLSKSLVKRGHEVIVFTPLRDNSKEREIIDGIEIRRISYSKLNYKLFYALMKQDFDIMHAHAIWSHVPASFFVSKMKKRKTIITPHHTWNFLKRNWSYNLYYHTLWKWMVKNASAVIALNQEEVGNLAMLKVKKEKIRVIPNAVDSIKFSPLHSDIIRQKYGFEGTIILFVGAISLLKGVHVLLESINNILKSYSDLYLVFIGEVHSNDAEDVTDFIKKNNITNNVLFMGHIPHDELPYFYSSADIFVTPSFSEGMPTALLEAMACGLPCIGTNVGGTKEVIEEMKTGLLVEAGNSEQLAEGIKLLLTDDKLRRKLGDNARRKIIEKYSWEKVTDQIENLYREVMED